MIPQKYINVLCCSLIVLAMVITGMVMVGAQTGVITQDTALGYENRLFDTGQVHTLNIVMEDWDTWVESCSDEEYAQCTVIIDNDAYSNVAIRAKGNTSLSNVANYGNNRYSFKIEFDHYDANKTYYGLDKLSLNNIIQDNTYMKDFLTYQMMDDFGVNAPLCSYVQILVNGEEWGLYLAVEGVEDSFLDRNFSGSGNLYKPDSTSMGGGRGQGKAFNMDDWKENNQNDLEEESSVSDESAESSESSLQQPSNAAGDPDAPFSDPTGGQEQHKETAAPPGFDPADQNDWNFAAGSPGSFDAADPQTEMTPPDGQENGTMPPGMQGAGNPGQPPEGMQTPPSGEMGTLDPVSGKGMGPGGFSMGSSDVSLIYTDDEVSSYSNIFDNAKTDVSEADQARLIESLRKLNNNEDIEEVVNIDEVIRYFVVHNFVCNFDSYTGSMIHNYYLYEEDGQFSMIPWDYNLAFGGFESQSDATGLVNYPIDSPVSGQDVESRPMLAWIFANEEYTALYHTYFQMFMDEYFANGTIPERIASTMEMIAPYVESDPTKFCTMEEFEAGVSTLKQFVVLRALSIQGQLDGTIGATADTQDSSALIDASALTISDMGSMNNGGMGPGTPDGMALGSRPEMEQNPDAKDSLQPPLQDTSEEKTAQPVQESVPAGESAGTSLDMQGDTDGDQVPEEGAPFGTDPGQPPMELPFAPGQEPAAPPSEMGNPDDGGFPLMADQESQEQWIAFEEGQEPMTSADEQERTMTASSAPGSDDVLASNPAGSNSETGTDDSSTEAAAAPAENDFAGRQDPPQMNLPQDPGAEAGRDMGPKDRSDDPAVVPSASTWMTLAASGVMLALGLAAAVVYKKPV